MSDIDIVDGLQQSLDNGAPDSQDFRTETIDQRHRRERKELQAKTIKMKHSVSKGDKKRKKEVTQQIAILEQELNERHEKELNDQELLEEANSGVESLTVNDEPSNATAPAKKISKAQRKREKKAAQARAREDEIKRAEEENISGPRYVETAAIKAKLKQRHLAIYEIPSDGNCLYRGVEHQLGLQGIETNTDTLRHRVAQHIRDKKDDFLPFLSNHETGDPFTEEEFEVYCRDLEHTPAWGGQLEIQALSSVLQHPIEVIQAQGPSVLTGEHYTSQPLTLVYHRHMYGLGEHYNSVTEYVESNDDEFT